MMQTLLQLITKSVAKVNLVRKLSCAKSVPRYRLRIAYPSDYDNVMRFMIDTYMRNEPSVVNIGGLAGHPTPMMIHLMHMNIREGMTIIAEDRANYCVVGAAVNIDSRKETVDKTIQLAECCECGPARDLIRFFAFISKQSDVWGNYCVSNVFECAHVAVHPEHQGHGIAKKLVAESWTLARDTAYRVFRIDASSRYTANIAENFSWRCIYSIPYTRYFDNGNFVFKNVTEPHTEMKVFVDRINYYKGYYPPSKNRKY